MKRKRKHFNNCQSRQDHQELINQIGEAREKFTENLLIDLQQKKKINDFVHFEKDSPPNRKGIDFEITTRGRRVVYLDVKSSFRALCRTLAKKQERHHLGHPLDKTPVIYYIPNLSNPGEERKNLLSLIKNSHPLR